MELVIGSKKCNSDNFDDIFRFYCEAIEQELKGFYERLDKDSENYPVLSKACQYSLSAGGKRIRPLLTLELCRVAGGNINDALPCAVAIELIHTFSLIHDDLPCMDDDDMRRGKPSCHIAFGEANALLAGDGLSVLAFKEIADRAKDPLAAVKTISILSDCVMKMIGGQINDVARTKWDLNGLYSMYELKTSQLLIAACCMGAVCAGADEEFISHAREYAYNLGIAFQIVDDILDVTATAEDLGKPIGSDNEQGKVTTVTLLSLEGAKKEALKYSEKAENELKYFSENKFLSELTAMLLRRNK